MELEKGKFYTLLGPSGCGKTTILRIIAGFSSATSGQVYLDGEPVTDVPANQRKVNTVFQDYALFPHMNVYDNIAFGLSVKKVDKATIKEKVTEALKMVRLSGYENRAISEMSGGQRQRVSIARAILKNPPILILDEATSALDTESERLVQDALYKLMRTRTTIAVAHRLSTIKNSDEICVMHEGEIVERGTHDELMEMNGYYKKLHDMQEI